MDQHDEVEKSVSEPDSDPNELSHIIEFDATTNATAAARSKQTESDEAAPQKSYWPEGASRKSGKRPLRDPLRRSYLHQLVQPAPPWLVDASGIDLGPEATVSDYLALGQIRAAQRGTIGAIRELGDRTGGRPDRAIPDAREVAPFIGLDEGARIYATAIYAHFMAEVGPARMKEYGLPIKALTDFLGPEVTRLMNLPVETPEPKSSNNEDLPLGNDDQAPPK